MLSYNVDAAGMPREQYCARKVKGTGAPRRLKI
jgi:hypothetical protein